MSIPKSSRFSNFRNTGPGPGEYNNKGSKRFSLKLKAVTGDLNTISTCRSKGYLFLCK